MVIAQEYRHFFASQQARASAQRYAAGPPSALQLSQQRAAKQATSDTVTHDHRVRLGHMFNRLAAPLSSLSQQQQAPWSPQQQQQQQSPPGRLIPWARPGSVAADMCIWLPRPCSSTGHRRPSTAPEQRANNSSSNSQPRQQAGSSSSTVRQQRDWQQLKAAAHPQPQPPLQPVQLPPSRFYVGPNLLPSVQHRMFKASLMGDILTRQLYRAADIRQLCVSFVHSNPPEHRNLLRQVAAEVLTELEVPYTTELDF